MPELLRLFIQIVVHEKSMKWSKRAQRAVEIHYTHIGYVGDTVSAADKQECDTEIQGKEMPRQVS